MEIFIPEHSASYPGFYEIPGFSRYAVSKNGDVVNKRTATLLTGSFNPAGYLNYRLTSDSRKTCTLGRHRLMGLVFKYPGLIASELVVNHKNGVKGDDRLDNLEWVTQQGNCEHAGATGLTEKCQPISVRNVDSGEVEKFPSIVECARRFGMSKDAINYRVKLGEHRIFPERKQYRGSHDDSPWYTPTSVEHALLLNGRAKGILVRYVLTGIEMEFGRLADLADHLDVTPTVMTNWTSKPGQPVLPGFIQLKMAHDPSPWREVTDPYVELAESMPGTVVVQTVDDATGSSRVYLSAAECAKENGLLKTTLNWRLKSAGSIVYSDGCRYGYYPISLVKSDSQSVQTVMSD